jgi:hypothetical protein
VHVESCEHCSAHPLVESLKPRLDHLGEGRPARAKALGYVERVPLDELVDPGGRPSDPLLLRGSALAGGVGAGRAHRSQINGSCGSTVFCTELTTRRSTVSSSRSRASLSIGSRPQATAGPRRS